MFRATALRSARPLLYRTTYRTTVSHSKISLARPSSRARTGLAAATLALAGAAGSATFCLAQDDSTQTQATDVEDEADFTLTQKCAAEAVGTGIIVGGGCGAVSALKYAGGTPIVSVAVAFGASVAVAAYLTAHISGAHLNPAVTLALALNKPDSTPKEIVAPYIAAQCGGATVAGALNYLVFRRGIMAMEKAEGLVRGAPGSAAVFDGAFGMVGNRAMLKTPGMLLAEVGMTAALLFAIFGITDPASAVPDGAAPAMIGTTVAVLVGVFGPVTGCGMNPARDLGPRLVTMLGGWGATALTPGWWAFTAGPCIGAVLGGAGYQFLATKNKKERKEIK